MTALRVIEGDRPARSAFERWLRAYENLAIETAAFYEAFWGEWWSVSVRPHGQDH